MFIYREGLRHSCPHAYKNVETSERSDSEIQFHQASSFIAQKRL